MPEPPPPPPGRWERFVRRLWWLHSLWALAFGVGVMVYARKGLAHADKLLLVLGASWFAMFVALRFVVGPDNQRPDDPLHKKGIRLVTNYVVKNLYQQMLFFLVPLYAASTTWSLSSPNVWLAPVLLAFAVLSTMDLVMDEVVMQRRAFAAVMYGFCMFGVLNLMLPLAVGMSHEDALLISAAAAAPAVALLTFRLRRVVTVGGIAVTVGAAGLLALSAHYGAVYVPPAPLAMVDGGVSHGRPGEFESVPGHKSAIRIDRLHELRCVTLLSHPGGLGDEIVHVWRHEGREFHPPTTRVTDAGVRGYLFRSHMPRLPDDPRGRWQCRVLTGGGQLAGMLAFEVVGSDSVGGERANGEGVAGLPEVHEADAGAEVERLLRGVDELEQ